METNQNARLKSLKRIINARFKEADFVRYVEISYAGHQSEAGSMQTVDCRRTNITIEFPVMEYPVPEYDRKGIAVHNRLMRMALTGRSMKS